MVLILTKIAAHQPVETAPYANERLAAKRCLNISLIFGRLYRRCSVSDGVTLISNFQAFCFSFLFWQIFFVWSRDIDVILSLIGH